jgi:hypothetical protein
MAGPQITSAGAVEQVFALTNSDPVSIVPPGQPAPLPGTTLAIHLNLPSLLVISFDARVFGLTSTATKTNGPFLALNCNFDGTPCEPNVNSIEDYAVPGFGHSQSFTWIVHNAKAGPHKIEIIATAINFGSGAGLIEEIDITNRTLTVFAARIERTK